jgi:hypothetical protein
MKGEEGKELIVGEERREKTEKVEKGREKGEKR